MKHRVNNRSIAGWLAVLPLLGACAVCLAGDLETDNLSVYGNGGFHGPVTISPFVGTTPTNDLEMFYAFTSDDGSAVADESGCNHTGTVSGATWSTNGYAGGGFDFDGVNDYISMGDGTLINTDNAFSFCTWIKTDKTNSYECLVTLKGTTEFLITLGINGGYLNYFGFRNNTAMRTTDNRFQLSNLASNWHHMALVFKGGTKGSAANWALYLDGVASAVTTANTCGSGSQYNRIACIGSPGSLWFDGKIDEAMLYDRALTANEIYSIYRDYNPSTNEAALVTEKFQVIGEGRFEDGIIYSKQRGDIGMGIYTNQP